MAQPTPTSPPNSNSKSKSNFKEKEEEKVITIGISGPSSAGKSTLAFLLSVIFASNPNSSSASASSIINQDDYFRPLTSLPLSNDGDGESPIITQDDYFLPKPTVPHSSYISSEPFVQRSARKGEDRLGLYSYTELDDESGVLGEGEGEGGGRWRVSGPDTDCAAAVDFAGLVGDVEAAKMDGEGALEGKGKGRGAKIKGNEDEPQQLRTRHAVLINELRALVEQHAGEGTRKRKFCFAEGFLLFVPALQITQPGTSPDSKMQISSSPSSLEPGLELAAQRQRLMQLLDIKLFLPTSKEKVMQRRFARMPYVDVDATGEGGGLRVPGQMWKARGYFEEVAWGNYEREAGWLIGGDRIGEGDLEGKREEVRVRGMEVEGVEDTLRWAVGVLLGVIGGL